MRKIQDTRWKELQVGSWSRSTQSVCRCYL